MARAQLGVAGRSPLCSANGRTAARSLLWRGAEHAHARQLTRSGALDESTSQLPLTLQLRNKVIFILMGQSLSNDTFCIDFQLLKVCHEQFLTSFGSPLIILINFRPFSNKSSSSSWHDSKCSNCPSLRFKVCSNETNFKSNIGFWLVARETVPFFRSDDQGWPKQVCQTT